MYRTKQHRIVTFGSETKATLGRKAKTVTEISLTASCLSNTLYEYRSLILSQITSHWLKAKLLFPSSVYASGSLVGIDT